MVDVFREVWRVLRDDGTLWLNLGDSYATNGGTAQPHRNSSGGFGGSDGRRTQGYALAGGGFERPATIGDGVKQKDLMGVPWRVAFALQDDGWVLRSEIIWQKPNPMPESVTDRPTKSHEQIFLFAKSNWVGPPVEQFAHISDEDARWLALLIDTEGSIVMRREASNGTKYGAHSAQVSIGGTSHPLMLAARDIVGTGNILERGGLNSPMYYWQVSGKQGAALLRRIYPYLIVKKRQARCLIHLESMKYHRGNAQRLADSEIAERERLWEAVKSLNHFGDPDISWVTEPTYGSWRGCNRYYYDADAVREAALASSETRYQTPYAGNKQNADRKMIGYSEGDKSHLVGAGRNKRTVWTIPTAPFPEAHFATFPPALVEPCIKAGTSEHGVCPTCGAPWKRVIQKGTTRSWHNHDDDLGRGQRDESNEFKGNNFYANYVPPTTIGWEQSCKCPATDPIPATVLDLFAGAGTTLLVASRLGRNGIGIELNPEYVDMAAERIRNDAPLFVTMEVDRGHNNEEPDRVQDDGVGNGDRVPATSHHQQDDLARALPDAAG